jgi:hypothetical protein
MNHKQRILMYVSAVLFALSFLFVPWRVADRMGGHYEFSPYWRPILFDEGGVLRPVLLYIEWAVLVGGFVVLYFCLRSKKEHHQ